MEQIGNNGKQPAFSRFYGHTGMAHTLREKDIGTHSDGWTIIGEIREDYFTWVNEFLAHHPIHGFVWGDFEDSVFADSKDGFDDFVKNHPPKEWDYGDI
jgi:hypothetical protein